MRSHNGRLVSIRTREEFEIIGMLFQSRSSFENSDVHEKGVQIEFNNPIVIHVHGNFGNFYQNKFLWYMSEIYLNRGIDFLTINLSAHDGLAEGYYGMQLKYVGGGVADYADSQLDIEAVVQYVRDLGYHNIVLQGHSLGCDKIIEYALNHEPDFPLILLSPVDSYEVQSNWIYPEKVEEQIRRLKGNCHKVENKQWGSADLDWLPNREYGAKGGTQEWTYEIPITRDALLSILEGVAFRYLNVSTGETFVLDNPVFAYIGRRDGLQMHSQDDWIKFLHRSFPHLTSVTNLDADHDIVGVEDVLAERITEWIDQII
ncbi:MAG: alpha/beta hydrolase [Lachnospiraceae bacterium]|nr:alpha/beta hydrolase [Lachnospiraceae bacterium]